MLETLSKCLATDQGGFCGGPFQIPHLAPTYAAISSIAILGTPEAYALINRYY